VTEADEPQMPNPRWRVRRQRGRPWWRRLIDRRLAQADVLAPDGTRYLVRIARNLPLRDSVVPGPVDALLPGQVTAALLVATNVYARGRTGWNIRIFRAATPYRAERFIHKERAHSLDVVVARAFDIVDAIRLGDRPWDDL
jgi:hypothetical protein